MMYHHNDNADGESEKVECTGDRWRGMLTNTGRLALLTSPSSAPTRTPQLSPPASGHRQGRQPSIFIQ
eukprot:8182851-Pyramimonas_sp.AAC.1